MKTKQTETEITKAIRQTLKQLGVFCWKVLPWPGSSGRGFMACFVGFSAVLESDENQRLRLFLAVLATH